MTRLVRQVAVVHVPFRKRAMAVIGALAQVTGVVTWLALAVAAILAFPIPMSRCHLSQSDIARYTVKAFAFEGYPSWAVAHPERTCPDALDDLGPYVAMRDSIDPWGQPYYFACGPMTVPDGVSGVWVLSAGPDGKFGTSDDIRSDR